MVAWTMKMSRPSSRAAAQARVVLPTPGLPSRRGLSGMSLGANSDHEASSCSNTSRCPIHVGISRTGRARCSSTPSISMTLFRLINLPRRTLIVALPNSVAVPVPERSSEPVVQSPLPERSHPSHCLPAGSLVCRRIRDQTMRQMAPPPHAGRISTRFPRGATHRIVCPHRPTDC